MPQINYAPGIRVEIRDAEWVIKRVDLSSDGGYLIRCEGLSEFGVCQASCPIS